MNNDNIKYHQEIGRNIIAQDTQKRCRVVRGKERERYVTRISQVDTDLERFLKTTFQEVSGLDFRDFRVWSESLSGQEEAIEKIKAFVRGSWDEPTHEPPEFIGRLEPIENSLYRKTEHLDFGEYTLSIQGNSGAYCTPRESRPYTHYTDMEVGLFREGEDGFIGPDPDGDELEQWLAEQDYFRGMYDVGGYIPVEAIQDLVDFMEGLQEVEEDLK